MSWTYPSHVTLLRERHFGDRVSACLADRPASPYAAFERAVLERPQAEALVIGAQRFSYVALDAHAACVAASLAARGVVPGDRIALWLGNRLEFVVMLLVAWRLGAIVVPMGARLQAPEVAYIVQHCGAVVLVHEATLADRLPKTIKMPFLNLRVSTGGAVNGSEPYEALAQGVPVSSRPLREEDVAAILYTSGTTGQPKGAMLSHLNLVHAMLTYKHAMGIGPCDRTLMAVPASHVTGLTANILLAWAAQGALIVMPEFKASAFLELAARERMTHTVIVPAMYKLCLLQPEFARHDLSHWRVGGYGGAPMAEATITALAEALPQLGLYNIYGSTETSGPVTLLPCELAAQRADSTGWVVPTADIVVMDEDGREVPPGAAGELWIRGPMVVPGYWDNRQATQQGFVGGFWRSGDVGSIDAEGFVRVFDRLKDMLNRGGYKIYSVEVEHVLLQHPAVVESAIVGKPCQVLGERVHAFVCMRPDFAADAAMSDELRRHCAERLADYKVPESLTLGHAPLARNANGKLLKREMRAQIQNEGVST